MKYTAVIATPKSGLNLGLKFSDAQLTSVDFLVDRYELLWPEDPRHIKIIQQFERYFIDPSTFFDLELQPQGTIFQQAVWQALRQIPAGQTLYYSELAQQLKSSARAVGNACRANPWPIVVPCHRVVAKSGLGGFMGQRDGESVNIKRWLLQRECGENGG